MPIASLALIAANVAWSDGQGAAQLFAGNIRFGNWTPHVEDIGQEEVAYGTGLTYQFVTRTDYTATFELGFMPPSAVPLLHRLKRWLDSGGVVTVNTMDASGSSYACVKQPGFKIGPPRLDRRTVRYTLSLGVKNTAASPLTCLYIAALGVGWSITVSPSPITLGGAIGATLPLTATVVDASGNIVTGIPVTWTTTNNSVATVGPTGIVTAIGTGSCSIIGAVGSTQAVVPCAVTINQSASSISLAPSSLAFTQTTYTTANPQQGQSGVPTQLLTATALNASGQSIALSPGILTWSVQGSGISIVDNGNGTCTVTAVQGSQAGTITCALTSDISISAQVGYSTVASQAAILVPSTFNLLLTAAGQSANISVATLSQYGELVP